MTPTTSLPITPTPAPAPAPAIVDGLSRHGDQPAIFTPQGVLTYSELDERVDHAAASYGDGRRLVLVAGANTTDSVVAYLAALRAGHVVMLTPDDHDTVARMTAAYDPDVVAVGADGWAPVTRHAAPTHDLHPDLSLLMSTSGSTGSPKLVRLSATNLDANAASIAEYLEITPDDRTATALPLNYCYGLSVLHSHLLTGAGLLLTGLSVVDRCFWDLFRRYGGTSFPAVPYTFDLLDRIDFADLDLPTLHTITQAGGRLAPERVRRYAELGARRGWRLIVMYGQTEATARMAYLPPHLATAYPGAIGVPVPGGSFEIEPVEGFESGVGELLYRGPNVMMGYAESPADLAAGATVDVLRTGDLARRNDAGLVEIVGRASRFVKLFGLRVDLDELERTLAAKGFDAVCAGDDEGLVVAIEGDDHGADAARVVRATTGLPASTVGVATFRALPRLTNGKPDYAAIRRAAAANPTPAAGRTVMPDPATAHGATDRVRARFAEVLGCTVGDIDDDATFVSLGGDSLSYVEMSIVLEEELGHLPADWHVTPVGRLAPVASGRRRRRRLHRLETGVALRALAILLVVGTHAGLFTVRGGAHVLLALAGLNFGRFQYGAALAGDALTPLLRSIARVAVPSVACIAVVAAVTGTYGPANLALVHGRFAGEEWDAGWRTWYIESLVQLLAVVAVPLAIPALRRALRRAPAVAPVAALAFGAAVRFDAVEVARSGVHRIHGTETVLWLFAFGWAAHRAERIHHRLALSALVLVAAPGYSGNPQRDAAITLGLLVMMWVRQVVVPAVAVHAVGTIASASLYIYLTHWQVYPWISEATHPLVAVVASVAFGVAVWRIADPAYGRVEGRVMRMWRARVARPDFESKNRSACGGGMAHHERDADVRGHHEGERRRRAVGGRRRT